LPVCGIIDNLFRCVQVIVAKLTLEQHNCKLAAADNLAPNCIMGMQRHVWRGMTPNAAAFLRRNKRRPAQVFARSSQPTIRRSGQPRVRPTSSIKWLSA